MFICFARRNQAMGTNKINAVLADVGLPLGFIPLELHGDSIIG